MSTSLGGEERREPALKPASTQQPEPSPYRRAPVAPAPLVRRPRSAEEETTPASVVNLPPGYRARVEREPASTGFLGRGFAMDSLEFLRWVAVYFHDDLLTLRVLVFLMGSQAPGGTIEATQKAIAQELQAHRTHVNRSIGILYHLGVVHMVKRGVYQLNPVASMRGGVVKVEESTQAFSTGEPVVRKIDQLVVIKSLREDPKVQEAFKQLELPGPLPKARKPRKAMQKASEE
ncbi:hypothetical protein ABT024_05030 [Streptomyces sp. NPDC002812]|uniref:hypothetical protein n=1 Tax=Streptomyces sp. NPDC002812 TaxID=3154434 RepID=UPI0033275F00